MREYLLAAACVILSLGTAQVHTAISEEMAFRIKNEAFANSSIDQLSQYMTDLLGPRLAASEMKVRSEQLVVKKLAEYGLSNPRSEFATMRNWQTLKQILVQVVTTIVVPLVFQ